MHTLLAIDVRCACKEVDFLRSSIRGGKRELPYGFGMRKSPKSVEAQLDDAVLRHGIHEMNVTFLQKPFSLGTLARRVRETLGGNETVL